MMDSREWIAQQDSFSVCSHVLCLPLTSPHAVLPVPLSWRPSSCQSHSLVSLLLSLLLLSSALIISVLEYPASTAMTFPLWMCCTMS